MVYRAVPDIKALRSLKNHGVDAEVDGMFDMGSETMALPMNEKMAYEQGDDGGSFGSVCRHNPRREI